MIKKKRGHIVAIASLSSKVTFPKQIAYCSTKFGVSGFMRALYDELCMDDDDEYVKTTTVYPSFINTRKEMMDFLDKTEVMAPRMSAKFVADAVVDGMMNNKRDITLPSGAGLMGLIE